MSGPYQYLDATGVIVPDTSDLESTVWDEFLTALGNDLVQNDETPQGVLVVAETTTRAEVVANNAGVANQINPNIAGGVFLEALCSLTGFDPPAATPTIISGCPVTGVATTTIPSGSQAKTDAGDLYELTADVTLDGSGNGVAQVQSVETGPIPAVVDTLTHLVTDVLGWETINNPNTATTVLGTSALSDQALRAMRNATLSLQGQGLAEAVTSAVAVVPGVLSQQFRENKTTSPATIDGISVNANSIWSCVDGGTNLDVATALLESVGGGCGFTGATSVNVTEPASGQVYTVLFDRPTPIAVKSKLTVRLPNSSVQVSDVVAAVLAYAAGQVASYQGFITGGSVSPFEIAGGVTAQIPGIYIQKSEVALVSGGGFQTTEIAIALNQKATLASSDITVVTI